MVDLLARHGWYPSHQYQYSSAPSGTTFFHCGHPGRTITLEQYGGFTVHESHSPYSSLTTQYPALVGADPERLLREYLESIK